MALHLDGTELRARGAFRAVAPLAGMRDVSASGGVVRFRAGSDEVALALGPAAGRWAAALRTPAPTLAAKLGIGAATRVLVDGTVDDPALEAALGEGTRVRTGAADAVVARVDDADTLAGVLRRRERRLAAGARVWVVYVKGKNAPLGETAVRALLRERGFVDVKVAAVSTRLTALAFVRRS
ncbi:MAG TPA: hypothetical protein VFB22_09735 [Candidatus Baltobacteraceae bacterium]|nr:hypothetical protein [Candidatus Baltobacteraceae bacterium]